MTKSGGRNRGRSLAPPPWKKDQKLPDKIRTEKKK